MYQTKLQMFLYELQIIACLMHFTEEYCLMLKMTKKRVAAHYMHFYAFLGYM